MFRRRFLLITVALVYGAIFPMWAQVTAVPISVTRDYVFPPVGLGASETASITVMNAATTGSPGGASPALAPSCTGTISFSNPNGEIGMPTPFTVGSEQFMTVTLPFASAGLLANRGEIQGKVSLTISTSMPTPCSLILSLETYDSTTGVTHAVLSDPRANVGPVFPVVPGTYSGLKERAAATELEMEVDKWTGFTDRFTHIKSGDVIGHLALVVRVQRP